MTLKNTKTILFASLIAAMVLPFSSMSFAQTDTVDNTTKNYVNDKINELNTKKNQTTNDNYDLEKLKLVRQ